MKRKGMTLRSIAALYMASPSWYELSNSSRRIYLYGMKSLEKLMDMPADKITRPMVIDLKDSLFEKSSSCHSAMKVLNNIMSFGYDRGMCQFNHAGSMRHLPKMTPIPRWTDEECDLFLEKAPLQMKRLFLLALYTGQRKSDLIRMKWDQYDGTYIHFKQQKTGTKLVIPVHPLLKAELEVMKEEKVMMFKAKRLIVSPYILHNSHSHPWSLSAVSEAMRKTLISLGIKGRSIHGLRKTTAAKLAEFGLSPHAIASVTGHKSLKEIMNYTKEADQVRLAEEAIARWS